MRDVNQRPMTPGVTVWLTGLPSSGKSTLARVVAERLTGSGRRAQVLDGDEIRARLSPDLGFSKEDREANVRRIGFVAQLLAAHGVTVLVPVIAPYAGTRDEVRAQHRAAGLRYLEIHVATPLEVCVERDVKGLYAKQAAGLIQGMTGVDDPYEAPIDPDLRLPAHEWSVDTCAEAVQALLR